MIRFLPRLTALTLIVALALLTYNCGKKNEDPAPTIAGTYKITAMTSTPGFPVSGVPITDLYAALGLSTPCFLQMTVTFSTAGAATLNIPSGCTLPEPTIETLTGFSRNSKWATNGNRLTITASNGTSQTTYDYTVSGNQLVLVGTNGTYTLNIKLDKA